MHSAQRQTKDAVSQRYTATAQWQGCVHLQTICCVQDRRRSGQQASGSGRPEMPEWMQAAAEPAYFEASASVQAAGSGSEASGRDHAFSGRQNPRSAAFDVTYDHVEECLG